MPHSSKGETATFQANAEDRIHARLEFLYGSEETEKIQSRFREIIQSHVQERPLSQADSRIWSEQTVILITYGDMVQRPGVPDLYALQQFLDRYLSDTLETIHILPFFPYSSDDGFSVLDFRTVNPALGDWNDIYDLGEKYTMMFDLVLNHVSSHSLWFNDFVNDVPPASNYFLEASEKINTALVVRPRSTPVLTPITTPGGIKLVWTTFSEDQIDLNYANPLVLLEILDILLMYVRMGARMLRLDAIPYLWKESGTSCIHLPQTHAIIKLLRDVLSIAAPDVILVAECNVPHQENISYFGESDEAHMVYNFSLPPLLLHAIYFGTTTVLSQWADTCLDTPKGCVFLNFIASHDGIGVRPLEGFVDDDQFKELISAMRARGGFVSMRRQADGSTSPYEINIALIDAVNDAIGSRGKWQNARFLCIHGAMLALRGIPAFYFHSLMGTENDYYGVEQSERTRSINRRRWDWSELTGLLNDPSTCYHQIFYAMNQLIHVRRQQAAFHPEAGQLVIHSDPRLFVVLRFDRDTGQFILAIHNFSAEVVHFKREALPEMLLSVESWQSLLGQETYRNDFLDIAVDPYAILWLSHQSNISKI